MGCGASSSTHVHIYTYERSVVYGIHRKKVKRAKQTREYSAPELYVWPPSAPCRAVLMAAKQAGIALRVKIVDILDDERNQADFLLINSDHKVPVLVAGDVKLTNSHQILPRLIDDYAPDHPVYPRDPSIRQEVDAMLAYDEQTAYPAIAAHVYSVIFSDKVAQTTSETRVQSGQEVLDHIDSRLKEGRFVAWNNVTIADLSVHATLSLLELVDWDFTSWTSVYKWMNAIRNMWYYSECNKGLEDWKFALQVKVSQSQDAAKWARKPFCD